MLLGGLLCHPGPRLGRAGVGRKGTCAEPEESRAGCRETGGGVQGTWFWSVPRVRRTGLNMLSRNGRAEEACRHSEWLGTHARDSKMLSCGGGATSCPGFGSDTAPSSQALCPVGSSQSLQHSHMLEASEEPEALPVRKGCQGTGEKASLDSAQVSFGVKKLLVPGQVYKVFPAQHRVGAGWAPLQMW